jgi:hypothetical protein
MTKSKTTAFYGKNGDLDFVRLEPDGEDIPTFVDEEGNISIIHPVTGETYNLVWA